MHDRALNLHNPDASEDKLERINVAFPPNYHSETRIKRHYVSRKQSERPFSLSKYKVILQLIFIEFQKNEAVCTPPQVGKDNQSQSMQAETTDDQTGVNRSHQIILVFYL